MDEVVGVLSIVNPSTSGQEILGYNENVDLDVSNFDTKNVIDMTAVINNSHFKSIALVEKLIQKK